MLDLSIISTIASELLSAHETKDIGLLSAILLHYAITLLTTVQR